VGDFDALKRHEARYCRDILHFCRAQNLAQMMDGKKIEGSAANLGHLFI
jgi:hypothetical protein